MTHKQDRFDLLHIPDASVGVKLSRIRLVQLGFWRSGVGNVRRVVNLAPAVCGFGVGVRERGGIIWGLLNFQRL